MGKSEPLKLIMGIPDFPPPLVGYKRIKIWITYRDLKGNVRTSWGHSPYPFFGIDLLKFLKLALGMGYEILAIWVKEPPQRKLALELLERVREKHRLGKLFGDPNTTDSIRP